jgi:NAD(P)-dependent dehydrogenase (short-subunit alcohol dehydrogenase family)
MAFSERRLEGKHALITGAGSGIGRAIALRYAKEGAKVVINDIDSDAAALIVDEIKAFDPDCFAIIGDVSESEIVQQMVKDYQTQHDRLDILVNNAGIGGSMSRVVSMSEDKWDRAIKINLRSVFLMCKYFGKPMIKQDAPENQIRGKIINVSSARGKKGRAEFAEYAASKAGVVSLTQSLALEMGKHRITVNCICPGVIHTPMYGAMSVEDLANANNLEPPCLKPVGDPEDVANVAFFLASDDSNYMTGQSLMVTGGRMFV